VRPFLCLANNVQEKQQEALGKQNRSRNPPPSSGSPTEKFLPGQTKMKRQKNVLAWLLQKKKIKKKYVQKKKKNKKIPLKNVRFAGHFQIFIKLSARPLSRPFFPSPSPTKSAHKSRVCVCGCGERPKGCQKHLN